ncbi:MAG: DNA replication/repair protein RecF [Candidatus Bipolaricaulota bacterium]
MKIRHFLLKNFRNLDEVDLSPHEELNLIVGPNGSGKTNFCEAIYFLSTAKTLKGTRQSEVIGWGASHTLIHVTVTGEDQLKAYLERGESKQAQINSKSAKQSELRRKLPVLTFTPEDLLVVKGGPRERREMLDSHLFLLSHDYERAYGKYRAELKKKNALLKKDDPNEEFLDVLNQRLAKLGATIMRLRAAFLDRMNGLLSEKYDQLLSGDKPELTMIYEEVPRLRAKKAEIEENLAQAFKAQKDKEKELETSVVGPHRDKIRYQLGGNDLRKFGSQGEQRSAVIATKLSLLKLYHDVLGEWPVLLLDDILSELDKGRENSLLHHIPQGPQVFLTSTEEEDLLDISANYKLYKISRGRVKLDEG